MKSPRHQLDEFVVITLADLFELSVPNVCVQVQSDLQSRKFFFLNFSGTAPVIGKEKREREEQKGVH